MAIDFDSLFEQVGRAGKVLSLLNTAQAGSVTAVNALLGFVPTADQDVTAALAQNRDALIRAAAATVGGQLASTASALVVRAVLTDQPTRAGSLAAALTELIRQMRAGGESVETCTVTATATAGTNTGVGAVVASTLRPDGYSQENLIAEAARLTCTTDSRSGGAAAGSEAFAWTGEPASAGAFDWDWPQGSGAGVVGSLTGGYALTDYPSGVNVLVNGGWDAWDGTTNPTDWTKTGTVTKETTLVYGTGAAACRVAAGDTGAVLQEFGGGTAAELAPTAAFGFALWVRGSAALSGGTLSVGLWDGADWVDDDAGNPSKVDVALNGVGTSYAAKTGAVRTPAVLPATLYLRVAVTSTPVGGAVILDHLAVVPLTYPYAGGPGLAVFLGDTAWAAGDLYAVTTTNDRAGATYAATFQALFDRLLGLSSLGLVLPSSGSPTQADSLISS